MRRRGEQHYGNPERMNSVFFFNKTSRALKSYEIWMEYGLKAKEKREKRGIGPKVTHDLHKV